MSTRARPRLIPCLLLAAALFVVGCQSAPATVSPEVPRDAYARTYAAAEQVLRDRGFILDRQDYRFGVLTTQPRTAPTLFEPWRHVRHTATQTLGATLNHQRRIVRIAFTPGDVSSTIEPSDAPSDSAAYRLEVRVDIEQIELPGRRLSGSRSGGAIFNQPRAMPAELQARGIHNNYWLPVARDTAMERRLLRAIQHRAEDL